jgi:hypothetical protein
MILYCDTETFSSIQSRGSMNISCFLCFTLGVIAVLIPGALQMYRAHKAFLKDLSARYPGRDRSKDWKVFTKNAE